MDKKSPEYVVCLCNKVTRAEILEKLEENKAKTMVEFCEVTGIGKRCGGCREDIENIVNEYWQERG